MRACDADKWDPHVSETEKLKMRYAMWRFDPEISGLRVRVVRASPLSTDRFVKDTCSSSTKQNNEARRWPAMAWMAAVLSPEINGEGRGGWWLLPGRARDDGERDYAGVGIGEGAYSSE